MQFLHSTASPFVLMAIQTDLPESAEAESIHQQVSETAESTGDDQQGHGTHSEGAAHHGAEPYTFEWLLETNVLNILWVALFLYVVVVKLGLHKVFHNQRDAISEELSQLYAQRDAAQAELKAIQDKTANLSEEVETILANARHASQEMADTLLSQATDEAAAIVERAKERMAQEEKRTIADLQERVLNDAVTAAKEALASAQAKDKEASVKAFANQLSNVTF